MSQAEKTEKAINRLTQAVGGLGLILGCGCFIPALMLLIVFLVVLLLGVCVGPTP